MAASVFKYMNKIGSQRQRMFRTFHQSVIGFIGRRAANYRHFASFRKWTEGDAKMARFYSQFVGAGDLVFGVGANMGNRAKIFLHLGCRVVCVEPQPDCVGVLRSSFKERISLEPCALSDRAGTEEMKVARANTITIGSIGSRRAGRFAAEMWDRKIEVRTKTLDQLIETYGRPRFVKVDVEGYEPMVVKGHVRH